MEPPKRAEPADAESAQRSAQRGPSLGQEAPAAPLGAQVGRPTDAASRMEGRADPAPAAGEEPRDRQPPAGATDREGEDQHPEPEDRCRPLASAEAAASRPGTGQDGGAAQHRRTDVRGWLQTRQERRSLGRLDQLHEDKECFVQETRGQLQASRQRTERIRGQQERLAAELAAETEASSTAAVGRLQAAARRLCMELDEEQALQAKLQAVLRESESALWHLELQRGRLEDVRTSAEEERAGAQRPRGDQAAERLHREREALGRAERGRLLRVRKATALQKEHGLRHQRLAEDAQRGHRAAIRFLKASLGRIQAQRRREELAGQEHMRRRMDAVLALKTSISANRETLRKFQAWGQARAQRAARKAQAEQEGVLAQGGDAFRLLVHQRRRQELEAQRRAFEEEQARRKQEIVARLLREGAEEAARERRQRPPARAPAPAALRQRTWAHLACCEGDGVEPPAQPQTEPTLSPAPCLMGVVSSESVQACAGLLSLDEETLAEPEIAGLWREDHQGLQVPKEDMDRKPVGGTRMEQDILARVIQRLRSGNVRPQVASGREFKGRPFNSKPELIHFKDFDVGKVYKKKVTLVNATYTINYCQLVGVEEHLRDFIHVHFDPPGPMPAGMSCQALVTFKPVVNKDMEGSVSFLAQTGGFSIPLKCSTKKCSLSLDKELVAFGSYVVGETASRPITLTNVGGLGTSFQLLREAEACDVNTLSPALKMPAFLAYDDTGSLDKRAASLSEQRLEGLEPGPLDAASRERPWEPGGREPRGPRPAESEAAVSGAPAPPEEEQPEIALGEVTEGNIGPFCSVKVPIIFTPAVPGEVHARFKVVFKNPQCPALYFSVTGTVVDMPVWVPRPVVDLKICTYDRLYQDSVVIHTRSRAALRLQLEVCEELRGHVELLPETSYIQALASCAVQLKFLPRHSLPEDAGKYFDKETRVLEAPMTIRVADQIRPVQFTIRAVVTTSDLELSPPLVDFGHCTVYEAVRAQVSLHNHSLLPQEFGFVGLPKFVDVQPGDGFGTILPLETLQLDVIFQPTKAREYSFELICKSEINRCFRLLCRAVGVLPPLELSHHQIKFPATALSDTAVATLYVTNPHQSMNSLTHSLPRVGTEDAFPVGPTSFEFLLPPDAPVTISPAVGTVLPGKRRLVQVAFRPMLPSELVCQQALQAQSKDVEVKWTRKDTVAQKKDLQKQSTSTLPLQSQDQDRGAWGSSSHGLELQGQEFRCSSDEYQAALAALTRSFKGKFDRLVVPCAVASGDVRDRRGAEPLSFSPHSALYLELWCPSVAPSIVVTSNKGRTVSNFGDIAVGHRGLKKTTIQNTSQEDLALEFSVLNPNGPFVLLNPISRLAAGETHVLALSFAPRESVLAQETLDIITKRGTLALTLRGTGVASVITCSIEGGVLNMGYVIVKESVSSTFKLQNNSSLPIKFSVDLESLSATRREAQRQLPRFLTSPWQRTEIVGTQNYSGQSVFSVVPVEGVMDPGKAQDFTVTFSPDHESLYFSDQLRVVLFGKKVSHQILLKGAAREHMMFVEGGDPLDVPVESLAVTPASDAEHREEAEELRSILVTLDYVPLDTEEPAPPASRELRVGCIRTSQLSPKKTVEFSVDSVSALQHRGFTVEPAKGSVERGQTKAISISWVPPADFDPDHPLTASALLQLRGGVRETYKVLFVARVVASS